MYFCNFEIISLWKRVGALHLNKVEFPSPKDLLCQLWLKLAHWFWRRRFLKFVNEFSQFQNSLPLEKFGALHLKKLETPLPNDTLCQVWLKLAKWFWRRRWKREKLLTTTTTTMMDNGQILLRKAHLSLRLRWAKKYTKSYPKKMRTIKTSINNTPNIKLYIWTTYRIFASGIFWHSVCSYKKLYLQYIYKMLLLIANHIHIKGVFYNVVESF